MDTSDLNSSDFSSLWVTLFINRLCTKARVVSCLAAELVSFLYKCYSMIFLTFYRFSCWGESQLCICSYLYPLFMELCVLSSFFTQNLISLFSHGNVYWFVSLCFDCAETNIFSAWLQLERKLNYQLLFVHSLPLFLTVIENKTHLL